MIISVQNLITSDKLSSEVSLPLIAELNAAESGLNSGHAGEATVQLRIFIIEVDIYIDSGILSPTNGQLLIDSANYILNA